MYLGALNIVMAFLLLEVNYKLIEDIKTGFWVILLVLAFAVYGGINFRNKSGGFLSYGNSYQHGLMMMAIGGLIYSIYNLLLYTVIAPDLPGKLIEVTIQKVQTKLSEIGLSEEIIKSDIEEARKSGASKFSISGVLIGYPLVLFFYAACALVTALFVRKSKPEFT